MCINAYSPVNKANDLKLLVVNLDNEANILDVVNATYMKGRSV